MKKKAKNERDSVDPSKIVRFLIKRQSDRPEKFSDKKFQRHFYRFYFATYKDLDDLRAQQADHQYTYDYTAYVPFEFLDARKYFQDYKSELTLDDVPTLTVALRDHLQKQMHEYLEFAWRMCPKTPRTKSEQDRRLTHEAMIDNCRMNLDEWQLKFDEYRGKGCYEEGVAENKSFLGIDEYFSYKTLLK